MKHLREIREARGWSREKLAAETGLSFTTIRSQELGINKNATTQTAEKLAQALEVPVSSLFFATHTEISVQEGSQ